MFKPETRIIAWDDCAFRFASKRVLLVGAIFRGGQFLDGMLSCRVAKDGMDATEKIASSILRSRHYDQLSLIMLDGISVAGLNIVDLAALSRETRLPVLAVQRTRPDIGTFVAALKRLGHYEKRLQAVKGAGKIFSHGGICYQKSGLSNGECREILDLTCTRAKVPEPLRVAHLIASGLSGESRGRA